MQALECSSALRVSLNWLFNGSSIFLKTIFAILYSDYHTTFEWKDTEKIVNSFSSLNVFTGVEGNL